MFFYFLRFLLLPLGWIYGLIVEIIRFSYRNGWKKSRRSDVATIVVGNLSTGGTGKTPQVEYILRHLSKYQQLVVLSRGYGRKSKGFHTVKTTDNAEISGDEPLQIARKFPEVPVIVSEDRVSAIEQILKNHQHTQLIVLDDAMQHHALKADCYLLLCSFQKPFFEDFILPVGNLREFRFNYKRADIMIVSKCPANLSMAEADKFLLKLKPLKQQKVFFSYLHYGAPYCSKDFEKKISWQDLVGFEVLFVSGIADTQSLESELNAQKINYKILKYPDHHQFTEQDKKIILKKFQNISHSKKILLCTEKDATKLTSLLDNSNLYILPIEVEIAFNKTPDLQRALVEVMYRKKGYPTG